MALTPQQLDFYRREGYVVAHDVLDVSELGRLHAAMNELLAGALGVSDHTALYALEDMHRPEMAYFIGRPYWIRTSDQRIKRH